MKIVIINKSDSTGGAAVVSRRLVEALRNIGEDARMLVVEKLTDSPYVEVAASPAKIKISFLAERLKIFLANGFNRATLFKIDTASDGLPLWNHPLVKGADAILLNWVNQGMLSLKGVERILKLGKPVIWTMHDMWCMTGVCHHAGQCNRYKEQCGDCLLLGKMRGNHDLSHKIWKRKERLGRLPERIRYVAVSNWLAAKARESSLLQRQSVSVIPNAFEIEDTPQSGNRLPKSKSEDGKTASGDDKIRILFGAARLDDPIKNLPALVAMTRIFAEDYPEMAGKLELVTFGNIRDATSFGGIAIPHRHLGMVRGEEAIRKIYEEGDIAVSSSSYETLPGTLVEAQAYGCIPVSFNQGGQSDIVDHLKTGYIAEYSPAAVEGGRRLAEGIVWAISQLGADEKRENILKAMRDNVVRRFSAESVAEAYINLIRSML